MCARDQCTIFSIGGKFRPDYGFLLELHALTLVARSYVLLLLPKVYIVLDSQAFGSPYNIRLPLSHHTLPELVGGGVLLGREEGPHQTHV